MAGNKDQKIGVNIGGNVGGEVNVAGGDIKKTEVGEVKGDYVGGDKVIHGDQVGGDKITVGNITGSTGVAIGAGASASVTTGVDPAAMAAAFDEIFAKLDALSRPAPQETPQAAPPELSAVPGEFPQAGLDEMPQAIPQDSTLVAPEVIEDAKAAVEEVRTEAEKGEEADEKFLARQFRNIARMGPDILDVVTATLVSPTAGIAAVLRKVAAKAREEAGLEAV